LAHGNETWREYSYLGGMDAIALGCLTAVLVSRRSLSPAALRALTTVGAAVLIFSLCFSVETEGWGLYRSGLDMSILGLGTCMCSASVAQSKWRAPIVLKPLLKLGQISYEVYLTHMFVVFVFFDFFVRRGQSLKEVPLLFVAVIFVAVLVGQLTSRYYSEPFNRLIRDRWANSEKQ